MQTGSLQLTIGTAESCSAACMRRLYCCCWVAWSKFPYVGRGHAVQLMRDEAGRAWRVAYSSLRGRRRRRSRLAERRPSGAVGFGAAPAQAAHITVGDVSATLLLTPQ